MPWFDRFAFWRRKPEPAPVVEQCPGGGEHTFIDVSTLVDRNTRVERCAKCPKVRRSPR